MHPDESFLNEVFGPFAIADNAVHKVQEPDLIALDDDVECASRTGEVCLHELTIIHGPELSARKVNSCRRLQRACGGLYHIKCPQLRSVVCLPIQWRAFAVPGHTIEAISANPFQYNGLQLLLDMGISLNNRTSS